jgi:hypothetical protein
MRPFAIKHQPGGHHVSPEYVQPNMARRARKATGLSRRQLLKQTKAARRSLAMT